MKYRDPAVLPPLVMDFLNYYDAIKNKSPKTIEEYALDLRTYFRFLKIYKGLVPSSEKFEEIYIKDIDLDFIKSISLSDTYAFLSYCKDDRDNDAAARARKVSSIKDFFKYICVNQKLMETNPMQELDRPKKQKSLPKYLTLEQSIQLLDSVDGKFKERDYCILVFLLNCGMRLAELVSLNYNDVRDNNTMVVTGKGNKQRTIYLNDACIDAYKSYMAVRPVDKVKGKDRNALFLSSRYQRISPKTVQHMVYMYLDKCGLGNEGFSVHKLRHTAATLMSQYGDVDVLVLKEILGHENVSTTEIYTHIVDKQLEEAAKSNPLSKVKPKKDESKKVE